MSRVAADVPRHLRRFVVEQDYEQYDAVDQAVWRFVLLQMQARLATTAHPAYRDGLAAAGITVDRIPRVAEMSEKLGRVGWSAVCVDGFIPPRAFQEFQAAAILPVGADMRTLPHLVYTPAPDIIHEAAGHAPILPDPVFGAYIKRIGELGQKAFTLPEEGRVYDAIYSLSEVKENPAATSQCIADAEEELRSALASVPEVSEATRLSRLYWWTAEYGLVGTPADYRLYGAGLLSSLWESHSCHSSRVRKLPLDEHCTELAYDITQPQPQLFVVPDFEALHGVLDRVSRTLASDIGGAFALDRAFRSQELATAELASGASVIGVLARGGPSIEEPAWLEFRGPSALAMDGRILPGHGPDEHRDGYIALTGRLEGGIPLERIGDAALAARCGRDGRTHLLFTTGVRVEGRLERTLRSGGGALQLLELTDVRLDLPRHGGRIELTLPRYALLAGGDFVGARAGAIDPLYYPDTEPSRVRVPKPRVLPPEGRALLELYQAAERAHYGDPARLEQEFRRVHAALERTSPDEWLLRWNLLESLLKSGRRGAFTRTLRVELERLEARFDGREPIASGLEYLARHG